MASIQKVKNKRGISYRVIIRKSGQKPISKTFKSKALAHQFISEIELSCEDKQRHLLSDLTFEELAQKYLNHASLGSRPKQQTMMTHFWVSHLGQRKVTEITAAKITSILQQLTERYANATVNRYKAVISVIFSFARRSLFAIDNPVMRIPALQEHNARTRFLSTTERTSLLNACKQSTWSKLYLLVLMAITTGARRSELLNLTWADIDLKRQLAYIRTSKNGEPRTLPLTQAITELLSRLNQDYSLVFHSERCPTKPYDFTKQWLKALEIAAIKDFRFHDLRHTCASYLAQGGASLLEIGEVLGHKQIQMTKRYAHLCVSHKQELINNHFGDLIAN